MRIRSFALCAALVLGITACGNSTSGSSGDGGGGGGGTAAPGSTASAADLNKKVPVDAPGVTDDEIRVGGVVSKTNPLGASYDQAFKGVEAYFEMINSQGGIYGRQLKLTSQRDDQVVNNQTEAQGLISQDDVFAVLPVATLVFSGSEALADSKIPTFGWIINPEWAGPQTFFGDKSTYLCFDCGYPLQPWLAQQNGKQNIGILGYGISEQSKQCAAGVKNAFTKWPTAKVAFEDTSIQFGATDLSVQVGKMKEAGVDFVITCMDNNGVTTLAKEMRKQELKATQYLQNGYDYDLIEQYGDLFEGSYVMTQFAPLETPDPPKGTSEYLEWIGKVGGQKGELSLAGWLDAALFVEGLKMAGPEFDREKLVAGLNTLTAWNADGAIPSVDWTIGHTGDPEKGCFAISKLEGGKFVPQYQEPGKPYICFEMQAKELPDQPEHSA